MKHICHAKCEDCGARERLLRHEFARASKPRCGRCGGWLRMSKDAMEVAKGATREARTLNAKIEGH